MFSQLLHSAFIKELAKDDFLFQEGVDSDNFWFVADGKIDLLVKKSSEFKYSR